jgi:predicted methyltransferase MtxX (methanogen marker protein 4)
MRLAYSAGVMKILHHRATRHFIALLVGCRCGKKFLHRLDRPVVACLQCGRTDDLGRIIEKLREVREAERRRAPKEARHSKIRAA